MATLKKRKATVVLAVTPQVAKLITKVQRRILKQPRLYNQDIWAKALTTPKRPGKAGTLPGCGTACCLAGEIVMCHPQFAGFPLKDRGDEAYEVNLMDGTSREIAYLAIEMLEATTEINYTLFSGNPSKDWPEPFAAQWARTQGTHYGRRARIAVARLEHFKVTGQ